LRFRSKTPSYPQDPLVFAQTTFRFAQNLPFSLKVPLLYIKTSSELKELTATTRKVSNLKRKSTTHYSFLFGFYKKLLLLNFFDKLIEAQGVRLLRNQRDR
jgi:hypothetical protein